MTGPAAGEVWAFIETEGRDNRLHVTSVAMAAEAKRLARRLKRRPCGVMFGLLSDSAAEELAGQGVEKLILINLNHAVATPETRARALVDLWQAHRPGHLVFAASARGADLAARVAAQTGCGYVPQVVDYEGRKGEPLILRTSVYGNRAHCRRELSDERPWILCLYPPSLAPGRSRGGGQLERVAFDAGESADPKGLNFEGTQSIAPADLDVREARIVIGVGRGVGNKQNLALINRLAERLGATVGGSRVAVEMGLIPLDRQIGLSGKRLHADIYIACGISGASHHLSGLAEVKHLVAINRDPAAPLMRMADLALVGDLQDVLPGLIGRLERPS